MCQTANFFAALIAPYIEHGFHESCGEDISTWFMEIRLCPPKGSRGYPESLFFPLLDAPKLCTDLVFDDYAVGKEMYVGVLPRRTAENGCSENVAAIGGLVVSIDNNDDDCKVAAELIKTAKLFTAPDKPRQRIPAPQIVVNSGGGLHCFWQMRTPMLLPAGDGHRRTQATSTIKRLARAIGSQPTMQENFTPASAEQNVYLSYLIRVPGSLNHKKRYIEQDGKPRSVRLLRLDDNDLWDDDYPAQELNWWRSNLPPDPAPVRHIRRSTNFATTVAERQPLRGDLLLLSPVPPRTRHDTAVRGAAMLSSAGIPHDEIIARLQKFAEINDWNATDAEILNISRHYANKDGQYNSPRYR